MVLWYMFLSLYDEVTRAIQKVTYILELKKPK